MIIGRVYPKIQYTIKQMRIISQKLVSYTKHKQINRPKYVFKDNFKYTSVITT